MYENKTDIKAYGAGLLSSFGEIEYACGSSNSNNNNNNNEYNDNHYNKNESDDNNETVNNNNTDNKNNNNNNNNNSSSSSERKYPKLLSWDPQLASTMNFPITEYQPTYFIAER